MHFFYKNKFNISNYSRYIFVTFIMCIYPSLPFFLLIKIYFSLRAKNSSVYSTVECFTLFK